LARAAMWSDNLCSSAFANSTLADSSTKCNFD